MWPCEEFRQKKYIYIYMNSLYYYFSVSLNLCQNLKEKSYTKQNQTFHKSKCQGWEVIQPLKIIRDHFFLLNYH